MMAMPAVWLLIISFIWLLTYWILDRTVGSAVIRDGSSNVILSSLRTRSLARLPVWAMLVVLLEGPLLVAIVYKLRHDAFWENDTEQACIASGGTWFNKQITGLYNTCAITTDPTQYNNTPLEGLVGNSRLNTNIQPTIGFCTCPEHFCWDIPAERCIPGEIYPES